jgi:hypothetical protein
MKPRYESDRNVKQFPVPEGFQGSKHGGGEPPMDGLEPRVARLESHVEHIQTDLIGMKADVRGIRDIVTSIDKRLIAVETGMPHLATKAWVYATLAVAAAGAIGSFATLFVLIAKLH